MVNADNSRTFRLIPIIKIASNGCSESLGKVASAADVDGDVVFFGSTCEGERVVLPYRDFRTAQKYVL